MGNTYLGQGQEGDLVWMKCDPVWVHIHISQVITFGTFEIPLLLLKISYFFFYLLLQLFNFNIIPYTYMYYVFLRNDPISPQPPKKPCIGKILKSTQNTFFTSFVARKWIKKAKGRECTMGNLMLLFLHGLKLNCYFEK